MKRDERKSGAVSVLLTCLLGTIIPVFLMLYGTALRETGQSAVEWNGSNAGRMVLSQYLPQLSDRYDIYGVWNEETVLEWRMRESMEASSPFWNEKQGSGLCRARLTEVCADGEPYSLMNPKEWERQIQSVMELGAVQEILQRTESAEKLRELFSLTEEGLRRREEVEEIDVQRSGRRRQTEGQEEEERKKAEELLQMQREREEEGRRHMETVQLTDGRRLEDPRLIEALPSRQRDIGETENFWDMLRRDSEQIGRRIRETLYTDLYGLHYFGCYTEPMDSWFSCEVEYLLQGGLSDESNFQKTKQELFVLRTALNMAAIYRDEGLREAVGALAAAAVPLPYPVAFGIISVSFAAAEGGYDVEKLLQGQSVPVLKSPGQWELLEAQGTGGGERWELSYQDYLQLLLLLRPQRTKVLRMMDLVQLNLVQELGEEFTLQECSGGFRWKVRAETRNVGGKWEAVHCEGESVYE